MLRCALILLASCGAAMVPPILPPTYAPTIEERACDVGERCGATEPADREACLYCVACLRALNEDALPKDAIEQLEAMSCDEVVIAAGISNAAACSALGTREEVLARTQCGAVVE